MTEHEAIVTIWEKHMDFEDYEGQCGMVRKCICFEPIPMGKGE